MATPQPLPTPRSAHLEMVGAVLAGDGLERLGEIGSPYTGAPLARVVPRLAGGRVGRATEAIAPVPTMSEIGRENV